MQRQIYPTNVNISIKGGMFITQSDAKLLQRIKEIIEEHVGENSPISSVEIANEINIDAGPSKVKIRKLILDVLKKYKIPIGANSKGYYIIQTNNEYHKYLGTLNSRIAEITSRITYLNQAYFKDIELTSTPYDSDEEFDDDFED